MCNSCGSSTRLYSPLASSTWLSHTIFHFRVRTMYLGVWCWRRVCVFKARDGGKSIRQAVSESGSQAVRQSVSQHGVLARAVGWLADWAGTRRAV